MVYDLVAAVIGAVAGILAVATLWVTVRAVSSGRTAYEANRSVTWANLAKTATGKMRDDGLSLEYRTSHGLQVDIRTGELSSQERLNSGAVNDVIGRPG